LTVNSDISSFSSTAQQNLVTGVCNLMGISTSHFVVAAVQSGSVVLTAAVTASQNQMNSLSQSNLATLGVTSFSVAQAAPAQVPASLGPSTSSQSTSSTPFYQSLVFIICISIGGFLVVALIVVIIAIVVRRRRNRARFSTTKYVDLEEYSEDTSVYEKEEEPPTYYTQKSYF